MPNISVLIADQHSVVRTGVRTILAQDKSLRVVAEAGNGVDAVKLARKHKPAVVLMDFPMPTWDGITVAIKLKQVSAESRVIFLSGQSDAYHISECVRVKAFGYLKKTDPVDGLAAHVRAVADGETAFAPDIAEHIRVRMGLPDYGKSIANGLTDREREIAQLISEGYYNHEIGAVMNMSAKRVEKIIAVAGEKLASHGHTRMDMADWWKEQGTGWSRKE